jgi:hypothetical protein
LQQQKRIITQDVKIFSIFDYNYFPDIYSEDNYFAKRIREIDHEIEKLKKISSPHLG